MEAVKVQKWIETDGELHLTGLPVQKWDHVEVIILIPERKTEEERQEALRRFNEHADAVRFKSTGPYPTRDELHERR
jgi:hypothetical protein